MLRLIDFLSTPTQKLWPLLFSCSLSLICLTLLFPTIHSLGLDKGCCSNKRSHCLSGPTVRLLREEDNSREAGKQRIGWEMGKRRKQRGRACSFTHSGGPRQPPSSQYPTSRRPHSETHLMNTPALIQSHNGALHSHWACLQWRTSPQLNPRDNEQGREKGGGVCAEYMCEWGGRDGGSAG